MLRVSFALVSALAVTACTKSPRPSGDGDAAKAKTMEPSPTTPAPSDKRATVRFTGSIGKMSSSVPFSTSRGRGAISPARSLSSPSFSSPGTKLHRQWWIARIECRQSPK